MSNQLADGSYRDDPDHFRELEWTFVRTLLSASAHEDEALESYFLQRYSRDDDADFEVVRRYLDDALLQHSRAIEDLELVRRPLGEVEQLRSYHGTGKYY